MSYYGVIFPEFWTGHTGRELRDRGGKDAQVLGLYLASNRHANMLGLYPLLVEDIKHETGLSFRSIEKGYTVAAEARFASFDVESGYVWVRQMARIRLGLKNGDTLNPEDKRVVAINRIYLALADNPFLGAFYDLNRKSLALRKRREGTALVVPFSADHYLSPLRRGTEGPSKPVTDQQVPGTEIRKQRSGTEGAPTARPAGPTDVPDPAQRRRVAPDGRARRAASAPVVTPPVVNPEGEAVYEKHFGVKR